jgi:hypothetical protein
VRHDFRPTPMKGTFIDWRVASTPTKPTRRHANTAPGSRRPPGSNLPRLELTYQRIQNNKGLYLYKYKRHQFMIRKKYRKRDIVRWLQRCQGRKWWCWLGGPHLSYDCTGDQSEGGKSTPASMNPRLDVASCAKTSWLDTHVIYFFKVWQKIVWRELHRHRH